MSTKLDEFYIRLYHGDAQDEALTEYLAQFDRGPRGTKSNEAKRLMYVGLQVTRDEKDALSLTLDDIRSVVQEVVESSAPAPQMGKLAEAVRDAVARAAREGVFTLPFTLADIRRVVAVTVEQKLDHLNSCSKEGQAPSEHSQEDSAVEDGLDRLGKSVVHWIDE